MITDVSKAYELLGVKPGVSSRELKAAHRDLAKVWHPDRFLHDPRLQEKAQEKLKEINEAYEIVSSGKIPRAANPPPPPRREPSVHYTVQYEAPARRGLNWRGPAAVLLVFAAVFMITTRSLLLRRSVPLQEERVEAKEVANPEQDRSTRPDANTRVEVRNTAPKSETENTAAEVTAPVSVTAQPAPAVASVTVTIDPESGLLAKPDCPLRSRMTYPSGSQPTAYCNINHAPPPKDSKLKSIAKTVKRTLD